MGATRFCRTAATITAALALTGGCASTADAQPPPTTLHWGACTKPDLPAELQCSTLDVPVDWNDPDGRTITLDLARAPATGTSEGAVEMNPGGPGGQGISDLGEELDHFAGLRRRMDVVSWNPRGSDGRYLPLDGRCVAGPAFVAPHDQPEYDAAVIAGAAAMKPCRNVDPVLFDHLDSATQAHDLDAIRAALGQGQVNYFGNSYGGVLGASYARLFPPRVRTMYIDSIVNHTSGRAADDADSYHNDEAQFTLFANWCAATPTCPLPDARRSWRDVTAAADRSPIPISGTAPPATYDGDDLRYLALGMLYHETWPQLADAIRRAAAGDARGFVFGKQIVPAMPAVAAATQCADGFMLDGYSDYVASRQRSAKLSANFAGERESYAMGCAGWPTPVANPPGPLPGTQLPPTLGAGPTIEYAGVRAMTDQVPGSVTIRYPTTGHGLYLNVGNRCVIAMADRYLTDRTLPAPNTTCPPDAP